MDDFFALLMFGLCLVIAFVSCYIVMRLFEIY